MLWRLLDTGDNATYPEYGLGNNGTMYWGHVEKVEPCKHGNIDGHYAGEYIDYSHGDQRRYTIWCPGAGIGGDDAK